MLRNTITDGGDNIAIGQDAMLSSASSGINVAIGHDALKGEQQQQIITNNVAIGFAPLDGNQWI